mgnify:CR=1 FL=1
MKFKNIRKPNILILFLMVITYLSSCSPLIPNKPYTSLENENLFFEMSSDNLITMDNLTEETASLDDFRKLVRKYRIAPPISVFEEYYDIIGPSAMLTVLEENKFCHDESHNLGRLIFNRTQDLGKSMAICGQRCTTGCFHGVLMGLFKQNDDHLKIDSINSSYLLKNLCDTPKIAQNIAKGNCFHAIGHALLFLTDYNITKGLEYCKLLDEKAAVYYCTTGIFMEYDIASSVYPTKNESLLYPCDTILDLPAACYRYKVRRLIRHSTNPNEIAKFCINLDKNRRLGCFHGLGFAYYKSIYNVPKSIINVCMHGNLDDQKMCIDGAIELVAMFNATVANEACKFLNTSIRDYCFQEAKYRTFNMKKPLDLYYLS